MKRMKNLLALVMAVVMVLALAIPAFAADAPKITVMNYGGDATEYNVYKVFDAEKDGTSGEYIYYIPASDTTRTGIFMKSTDSTNPDYLASKFDGIGFTYDQANSRYLVKKSADFDAAKFAQDLASAGLTAETFTTAPADDGKNLVISMNAPTDANKGGYYYVTYNNQPYALTTALAGENSHIQKKSDMPFDKDVYRLNGTEDTYEQYRKALVEAKIALEADPTNTSLQTDYNTALSNYLNNVDSTYVASGASATASHDKKSVETGDILHYVIKGKVPVVNEGESYYYYVWDTLSAGQEFVPGSLKIKMPLTNGTGTTDVIGQYTQISDLESALSGDQYHIRPNKTNPEANTPWTFDINIDFAAHQGGAAADDDYIEGNEFTIEYDAVVTKQVGVIDNTAHVTYQHNGGTIYNKDAMTQNYVNKIVIDKYETGNSSQKLAGAEFVLVKSGTYTADTDSWSADTLFYKWDAANEQVLWVTGIANADKKVTLSDGSAEFIGLEDGTYKLHETKAPDGFVKLSTPVDVKVDGKSSLDNTLVVENDPTTTAGNQLVQLTSIAAVANTPGSVLPSTGGRGTTMLYMAGLGMMLAAGAFLIFRRRAEAGK